MNGSVLLPVRAQPGAKKNAVTGVTGVHDARLKVSVTQAPEKGKANRAIIQVLADSLGIKRSQITLQSGESSSQKVFVVSGSSVDQLKQRIDSIL